MTHPKSHYHNKVVCVTGAGGSIGSEICRRLVEYEVAKLIMVGHSEIALYKIERELGWRAQRTDIAEAILSAWRWFSAHPDGYAD